ncbi:MAG TPA: VTT domain-containing protein [Patescibacteria group bacterium]|nr:VTT domain-containing protein [Patescibacteria group bacterium]
MDVSNILRTTEFLFLKWGYFLVFLASFFETSPFGFLIPGSLIVALAGYYSYSSNLSLAGVIIFGTFGMMTTFLIGYFLGYKSGYSVVKLFNQEKNSDRAKKILTKHGAAVITTALIANTTRFWMAYVSGIEKYNFFKFFFYATVSSLSWNSLIVAIGYLAGTERFTIEKGLTGVGLFSYALLIILSLIVFRIFKSKEF